MDDISIKLEDKGNLSDYKIMRDPRIFTSRRNVLSLIRICLLFVKIFLLFTRFLFSIFLFSNIFYRFDIKCDVTLLGASSQGLGYCPAGGRSPGSSFPFPGGSDPLHLYRSGVLIL